MAFFAGKRPQALVIVMIESGVLTCVTPTLVF
jgi:hypothetical protein